MRNADGDPMSLICDVGFCAYVENVREHGYVLKGDGIFFRNSHVRVKTLQTAHLCTIAVGERAYRLGMRRGSVPSLEQKCSPIVMRAKWRCRTSNLV